MNRTLLPLVVALALAGTVAQTHAQSLTRPDLGGSLLDRIDPPRTDLTQIEVQQPTTPAAVNITTRGGVTGSASQISSGNGASTRGSQTLAVGSTLNLVNATGSIRTDARLDGDVLQLRNGARAESPTIQEVRVGTVGGTITARDVQSQGVATTRINQVDNGSAAGGSSIQGAQRVDVGGIRDVRGGSIVSDAVLSSSNVSQIQNGAVQQELLIGSVTDSNLQNAQTRGLVGGRVNQVATSGVSPNDGQFLRVGAIDGAQAQSVRTSGVVEGSVTQLQQQGAQQTIDVGAVAGVDAAGSVATEGFVSGAVRQTTGGPVNQALSVASVFGGSPRTAAARATVSGEITQSAQGTQPGTIQRIDVATITGHSGSVTTDAVVTADLLQAQTGGGENKSQFLQIARVLGGTGTVSARATVQGSVAQDMTTALGSSQQIRIGGVRNASGTVATDAQVNANLVQSASGNSRENQLMLIGSVN